MDWIGIIQIVVVKRLWRQRRWGRSRHVNKGAGWEDEIHGLTRLPLNFECSLVRPHTYSGTFNIWPITTRGLEKLSYGISMPDPNRDNWAYAFYFSLQACIYMPDSAQCLPTTSLYT